MSAPIVVHWAAEEIARGRAGRRHRRTDRADCPAVHPQRTLAGGILAEMVTGYGAATKHAAYASAAAVGLAVVMDAADAGGWHGALQLCCAAFLPRMAVVRTVRLAPPVLRGTSAAPLRQLRPVAGLGDGAGVDAGQPDDAARLRHADARYPG